MAIRRGEWKLVKLGKKPAELYDLESDASESNNVASENMKRQTGMLQMLLRWKLDTMRGATVQPD
jgi:hypothetical protein